MLDNDWQVYIGRREPFEMRSCDLRSSMLSLHPGTSPKFSSPTMKSPWFSLSQSRNKNTHPAIQGQHNILWRTHFGLFAIYRFKLYYSLNISHTFFRITGIGSFLFYKTSVQLGCVLRPLICSQLGGYCVECCNRMYSNFSEFPCIGTWILTAGTCTDILSWGCEAVYW